MSCSDLTTSTNVAFSRLLRLHPASRKVKDAEQRGVIADEAVIAMVTGRRS